MSASRIIALYIPMHSCSTMALQFHDSIPGCQPTPHQSQWSLLDHFLRHHPAVWVATNNKTIFFSFSFSFSHFIFTVHQCYVWSFECSKDCFQWVCFHVWLTNYQNTHKKLRCWGTQLNTITYFWNDVSKKCHNVCTAVVQWKVKFTFD